MFQNWTTTNEKGDEISYCPCATNGVKKKTKKKEVIYYKPRCSHYKKQVKEEKKPAKGQKGQKYVQGVATIFLIQRRKKKATKAEVRQRVAPTVKEEPCTCSFTWWMMLGFLRVCIVIIILNAAETKR